MDSLSPRLATVFVVDDDDAVRDSIKVLLEVHGIDVEDFDSVTQFASNYHNTGRGCLILDQHLPVLTGIDFLESPVGKEIAMPVIMITGRGDPGLEKRARRAGVVEFLQKPISERALLAAVERAVAAQGAPPANGSRAGNAKPAQRRDRPPGSAACPDAPDRL